MLLFNNYNTNALFFAYESESSFQDNSLVCLLKYSVVLTIFVKSIHDKIVGIIYNPCL